MARAFSLHAEILRRFDDPDAEELLPVAVDRHPRRQRMLRREKPSRQGKPVRFRIGRERRQRRGRARGYFRGGLVIRTLSQHECIPRLGQFLHDHDARDRGAELVPLVDRLLDARDRVGIVGVGILELVVDL
jgi:hypothetical protein